MTQMKRRDMLRLVGAGCLSTILPGRSDAEARSEYIPGQRGNVAGSPAAPNLMQTAHKTGAVSDSVNESYSWRDDHTLLFLRRAPDKTVFHLVLVDARTGRETLPQAFNNKNSPLMEGGRMKMTFPGSPGGSMQYMPPTAAMSPNGKWLLWSSLPFPVPSGRKQWIASTLNGQQQTWPLDSDPGSSVGFVPTDALWMPDSKHWVELVRRYKDRAYSFPLAHEYELGKSVPVRTVLVSGLADGLPVGVRQDGIVVMHTSARNTGRPIQQLTLSLVGLKAATATVQILNVSIPVSSSVSDVTLSPKGDRLAWIVNKDRIPTGLHTLYVADADGGHARAVGSAAGVRLGNRFSWPRGLRWLPDGKHVSFVYKNAIYTHSI